MTVTLEISKKFPTAEIYHLFEEDSHDYCGDVDDAVDGDGLCTMDP
jgi:hypothetical protein